jgi:predicted RecA/RadA family phage recombinase
MKLTNTTGEDLRIDLGIDLSYQGRTVETLSADTCIRAGQTLNGRLNGIYFIPERLTTEQIKDGGTQVELSRTDVGSCDRP